MTKADRMKKKIVTNEQEVGDRIVHDGTLKEWQKVAWLHLRKATAIDKDQYPVILDLNYKRENGRSN